MATFESFFPPSRLTGFFIPNGMMDGYSSTELKIP
jgi:hypothetical protein